MEKIDGPCAAWLYQEELTRAKAIFYIIGNAEMGWESYIMSTEKLCFLSEECNGTREKCSVVSLQNHFSVLGRNQGAQELRSQVLCSGMKRKSLLKVPCQLQPGWVVTEDKEEGICSITQCRALEARAPEQKNELAHAMP